MGGERNNINDGHIIREMLPKYFYIMEKNLYGRKEGYHLLTSVELGSCGCVFKYADQLVLNRNLNIVKKTS